jgi:phosphate transport system substrate-binding protein
MILIVISFVLLVLLSISTISAQTYGQGQIRINGAGATFPLPLIDTWKMQYQIVDPTITINYQSIGSGGGVKQFIEKTVDFGATDAPLGLEEERQVSGAVVHIPETIGSVVAAYNIPGVAAKQLKLTGPILADIFLGEITNWNDTRIQSTNPGITLPAKNITVVHRSDVSGTTFVLTDYLSNVSSAWNEQIGKGKSVQWPVGIGAPRNEGVADTIEKTPNSIGYVELAYALTTGMNYASIKNKEGNFIAPSLKTTRAAAVSAASLSLPAAGDQSWSNVSMINAPGTDSYPIVSFSYLLLYKDLSTNINNQQKAQKLVDFIAWAINEGQRFGPPLGYVPLSGEVVNLNQKTLQSLTFKESPLNFSSSSSTG